ncbi:hypothetical protein ACFX13_043018 [Malus domestica]|nr:anthocyanidin 3-O-glucosyltransferase 2 [Malus domestica]
MAPPPPTKIEPQTTNGQPHLADAYDRHVVAAAFPFATHASPMLDIVRRLAAALPNTLFSFFSTSKSNSSLFSNNSNNNMPPNIRVYDVADGVPEGYVFVGKPQEDIELFMKAAPENLRRSLDASVADTGKHISCLITDAFLWFGVHLADDLGALWVPFWLSGLNSLSVHVHTDLIRDTIGTQGITGRENELIVDKNVNIQGLSKVRIKDLQEGVIFGNLDSVFSRMLLQMGRLLPRATAVFMNCFEELDLPVTNDLKFKFNKLLNVGPSNVASRLPPLPPSDALILSWLDKQDAPSSVVYVSFGSVATPPEKELLAIAEALEATGAPFLWSLKDNFKTPLLNEFLTKILSKVNGMVVPWAPQPHVLAHASVGAFVSHCGWNSLLETIAGGVPMICRPFFGDHRLNARMVEDELEIGVNVEGGVFTTEGLVKSLEVVLLAESGRKFRDNIKKVKQLAVEAVGPQGSSTRNFKSLLDVISGSNKA